MHYQGVNVVVKVGSLGDGQRGKVFPVL